MGGFAWQDGYAAISVSPSRVDVVRRYIGQQERHHGKRTFEAEYSALLDKSGVQHSAEYGWGSVAALRLARLFPNMNGGLRPRLTSCRRCAAGV